ncbi:hypothetical protein E1A91_A04G169500v1 [Gossypium mustelinum]|uniref:TF-B3 domain-containing protein n=1 Tax=Gossypium mustelinum TaxID=34275 RepID=A0A5D2ZRY4_GOSMU|nr:hypothetical protein E1A91_A04G169500v1 [Gossypium mustelinum]
MASQITKLISKNLTDTDIKKRLAIPTESLSSLPSFNGSHAVTIHLRCNTRVWPIACTVRKQGYKKPVFSHGWRKFVVHNELRIGDRITIYKVQHQGGSSNSHFRVEVEKQPASAINQHGNGGSATEAEAEATEINLLGIAEGGGAMTACGSGTSGEHASGEVCCNVISTNHHQGLSLDLTLAPPSKDCHFS